MLWQSLVITVISGDFAKQVRVFPGALPSLHQGLDGGVGSSEAVSRHFMLLEDLTDLSSDEKTKGLRALELVEGGQSLLHLHCEPE